MKKTKITAVLLIWIGVIVAAVLGLMALEGFDQDQSVSSKALLVGLGVVAMLMIAIGFNLLLTARSPEAAEPKPPASYRHTYRLFFIIAGVMAVAFVARMILVPSTFGQYGYFRGAAVDDARAKSPRHIDEQRCGECHEEQFRKHEKDMHTAVQCGTCHGPGWKHAEDPENQKVKVPDGKEDCLVCHRRLDARPASFPQINWREHYLFVGVKDETITCLNCHDPHEPLFMDREKRSARLHPLVHRCRDCHTGRVNESLPRPEDHPAIFECNYCHKDLSEDFAAKPHGKVRCTTCHLFSKETEYAGRIIRDADPRFCLLCHKNAEFRSSSAPPGIDWPDHREEVGESPEDAKKRCVDCHLERIHIRSHGGSDE